MGSGPRPADQVVNVVETLGDVIELAAFGAAGHFHDAPFGQAFELRAALACLQPGLVGNLPGGNRFPEMNEGEINLPLLGRERVEVALEVFGVVVDQVEKIIHQLAKRQFRPEAGQNRK